MVSSSKGAQGVSPLRFGIMCSGPTFAAWEAACIHSLIAVEGVELALLVVDDRPPPTVSLRERLRHLLNPKTLLWRLYQRAIVNRQSQSTRVTDLSAELAHIPILQCDPRKCGQFVQRFRPEEVAAIREYDLDFILRFAFNILRGEVLEAARYGIWSFHHDDPDLYRGTPPAFWEVRRGDPVTGTVLQRLTERLDAGVMLHKGYFKTDFASYPRSRDNVFFGAADWPARVCRQIQAGKIADLETTASSTVAPIYRSPNSLQMLSFLWASGQAWVANHWRTLFRVQQWTVGIIEAPIEQVAGISGRNISASLIQSARWYPEPEQRFIADPFAVQNHGGLTVLAEDYNWSTGLGHIVALEVAEDGSMGSPRTAIRLPTHLSYPFLLETDGELYCLPESSQSGEVALFQASKDRQNWRKKFTLITGSPVIDPTIFRFGENWWLFGTLAGAGDNSKLFAWHADRLTGPWRPHLANPLKTDIRSSRPAGPPFVYKGQLYRPAQDCSTGYGAAVVINRVIALTLDHFEEEVVSRIAPDEKGKYPTGLHTLCAAGDKTIIDGSRSAFNGRATSRALKRKLGYFLGRRERLTTSTKKFEYCSATTSQL